MCLDPEGAEEQLEEGYRGWTLRDRLELLAFDAGLAGVPPGGGSGVLDGDGLQLVRHIVAGVQCIFELVVQPLPPDHIHRIRPSGE